MEAFMTLNLSAHSENLSEIIKLFQQIGWDLYNPQGQIEYLPIGDDDAFDWQCEALSENAFYEIVSEKAEKKEQVGVNLFYQKGGEGISFLACATDNIMLSILINRRITKERHTDMIWYLEHIVYPFFDIGVRFVSYELKEYED